MPSLKLWKFDDGYDPYQLIADTGPGRRFFTHLGANNQSGFDNIGYTQPSRKKRLNGREYSELCYVVGNTDLESDKHQIHFDITSEDGSGTWRWMREAHDLAYPSDPWQMNTYNRMRFALWNPENVEPMVSNPQSSGPGCQIKAYLRKQGTALSTNVNFDSNYGSAPGDLYHYFHQLLPGAWQFHILDTHPTYIISRPPDNAWQDAAYPWRYDDPPSLDKTYFDNFTFWFYQNHFETTTNKPLEYYIDDLVVYQDPYELGELVEIYSITGCIKPSEGRCVVSWAVPFPKFYTEQGNPMFNCDVRYAFSDIHTLTNKWDDATPAPNGTNLPNPNSVYSTYIYDTSDIDLGDNDFIWFGIRATTKTGNDEFRQICLPCKLDGNPPIPGD